MEVRMCKMNESAQQILNIETNKRNSFLNSFLILIVRSYQKSLALFFGGSCRFYPTCSQYAVEAFESHKITYALFLILKRLLKCHPFGESGFDPVPIKIIK